VLLKHLEEVEREQGGVCECRQRDLH
jgi:hypothetical protein